MGESRTFAANLIPLGDVGDLSKDGWKPMENLLLCCIGRTQVMSGVTP